MSNKIHVSSSPHFNLKCNTTMIMGTVLFALLPEIIMGIVLFRWATLIRILVSVASCVLFEFCFQKMTKQKVVIGNLSACVTGVMMALVSPPTAPVWIFVVGAAVAMIVAKGLFGGIGSNVFNPALTGRAFMFLSFPAAMGASWLTPKTISAVDAISSATTLSAMKAGTFAVEQGTYWQYFIGNRAGCIGETSTLLILISFAFLALAHIIDWRAPVAMVGTVAICSCIAGENVAMALMTGGLMFGATFMVTDYATAPLTKKGRLIFGFGCGLITFLIRRFGGYPEGVMFSILIMNSVAPFLNNLTARKYGYGKKAGRPADAKEVK
ncbi:electron transport complex protein RnfD [Treponema bryantii]|uniref:Ion-translocating oxidoreductase complex subunit D n=1 Tax=Treponema bryantii TaxID=163 RepID=A0A1H9IM81_9SPIR|nr:RnfABCDGE type electron transport complex subunit D [Treponema bryantii]SEQ75841.1 electron transport complex protein RnfD [Treponema bryantii]